MDTLFESTAAPHASAAQLPGRPSVDNLIQGSLDSASAVKSGRHPMLMVDSLDSLDAQIDIKRGNVRPAAAAKSGSSSKTTLARVETRGKAGSTMT